MISGARVSIQALSPHALLRYRAGKEYRSASSGDVLFLPTIATERNMRFSVGQ